jgi:hypothetical protein
VRRRFGVRARLDAPDHEKNIFDGLALEAVIELSRDHVFHELQLLHPHRAGNFYEKGAVADLLGLSIAGDHRADDIVPDRPDRVIVQARGEIQALERLLQYLAEAFR